MLYRNLFRRRKQQRSCGRTISGMRIVSHEDVFPTNLIHSHEITNRFLEGAKGFVVVQVTDVLAHECLTVDHERDRILQIGPHGQDWPLHRQGRQRARSVAARAPQNHRTKHSGARHGVIHPARDGALADQECVRDPGETIQRVLVFVGNRFAGTVGAGHDQDVRSAPGKEQMLQRRIRQYGAQPRHVRCDACQHGFVVS